MLQPHLTSKQPLQSPQLLGRADGCIVDGHIGSEKRRASSQCLPFSHALMTALQLTTSGFSDVYSI